MTAAARMPVQPATVGTVLLHGLNAEYTIGRDFAIRAALALAHAEPYLACDIESEGLGRAGLNLKCVTVGTRSRAVVLDPRDAAQAQAIRDVLAAAPVLVLHNAPFDVPILVRLGLMRHADIAKVRDTLVYCRLAEPDERTSKGLLAAGARYLGGSATNQLEVAFKTLGLTKTAGYREFDLDRSLYVIGAVADVIVTARLYEVVRDAAYRRLTEGHPFKTSGLSSIEAREMVEREQVINRMFIRRAATGIRVDLEMLDTYRAEVRAQQDVDRALLEDFGIKPGNGASLTSWLEEMGLLPYDYPRTPKTGAPQATKDALATLQHPVAQAFVHLKETEKIEKDYLQKVVDLADDDDRIHPTTTILGAATGRMSMSDPPLQQFPEGARGIILADRGDALTSLDWSQIEPVVAANIARDEKVLAGYEAGTSDLYATVADRAAISRKHAKVVVLAQMYGEGMAALAADLNIDIQGAYEIRDQVFAAMPAVARWIRRLRDIAEVYRLTITMSGRILPIPSAGNRVAVHKAPNYHVQGSAYDVLAEALIRIESAGLGDAVYLAMHDELVVSTGAARDIEKIMQDPPERLIMFAGRTPTLRTDRADLGQRWAVA